MKKPKTPQKSGFWGVLHRGRVESTPQPCRSQKSPALFALRYLKYLYYVFKLDVITLYVVLTIICTQNRFELCNY